MLTLNELFSGIGSQSASLERLGIDFKVVGIAEIDKYAIKSYEAIHGPVRNYGDISKIEKLDYADFWTYSFPCQDISVAGKLQGIKHGKTRSGLLYEVERLLEKSEDCGELPKYLMLENVKNLVGKKFKPQFEEWIERLDELGYNTYWQVLNAKNYGIPQNRERVFGISIRKDIDTGYVFPEPFELKIRLKDILEDEVDEKFYINNEKANKLIRQFQINDEVDFLLGGEQKNQSIKTDGISTCLTSSMGTGGGYVPMVTEPIVCEQRTDEGLRFFKGGACGALRTIDSCGDKRVLEPKIELGRMGRQAIETYNEKQPNYGDTGNPFNKTVDSSNNCPTITTRPEGFKTAILPVTQDYRIRKLTPKECWRLMGFRDEQFQKAQDVGVSNSQLYKQAGNSIVVDVLYYLFKNLFVDKPTEKVEPKSELPGQMNIMDFMGG